MKINIDSLKKVVLFLIVSLVVYGNSLSNGFVGDDRAQLIENNQIRSLKNIPTFFTGSTFYSKEAEASSGMYYRPMMQTVFALIYPLSGKGVFLYHFAQILLHGANTILICYIFERFFKKKVALILALFFLIHPINTETVNYLSDFQDILFLFFGLCSMVVLRVKKAKVPSKRIFFSLLFLSLSFFSKETGVLFVIVNTVYIYMNSKKQTIKYFSYAIATVLVFIAIRYRAIGAIHLSNEAFPLMGQSLTQRLLHLPKIIYFYMKTAVFPIKLGVAQHWAVETIDLLNFIVPLIIDIMILVFIVYGGYILRRKDQRLFNGFVFFGIWLLIGIGFHSQIIPLDMTVAERWFYFPLIGFLGIIGYIATNLLSIQRQWQRTGEICLLALVGGFFVVRTLTRNKDWKDSMTLYAHDIRYVKDSFSLESDYGVELWRNERYDEAQQHLEKSVALVDNWSLSQNNLATVYATIGTARKNKDFIAKARIAYEKSVDIGGYLPAYENLARLLINEYDPIEAKDFIVKTLEKFPSWSVLWGFLSRVEVTLKNYDEALNAAKNAYQLSSDQANRDWYVYLKNQLAVEK